MNRHVAFDRSSRSDASGCAASSSASLGLVPGRVLAAAGQVVAGHRLEGAGVAPEQLDVIGAQDEEIELGPRRQCGDEWQQVRFGCHGHQRRGVARHDDEIGAACSDEDGDALVRFALDAVEALDRGVEECGDARIVE